MEGLYSLLPPDSVQNNKIWFKNINDYSLFGSRMVVLVKQYLQVYDGQLDKGT